ncbi:MAG TPA: Dyp-type peroxidase [Solirubrobacteraceae bacterium]|nr:Dyp-type peroxidase [Solirubrobacteraceae bacterium]
MIAPEDIQGNILRGYARHLHAAYLLTRFDDREQARAFIARLVDEDRIATERDWGEPPQTRLNVAFTHSGLQRLREDPAPFARFTDFCEGMRARARAELGDLGANDPNHWDRSLKEEIHALFTVYGRSGDVRRDAARALTRELSAAGMAVVHHQCADLLKSGREHFGYRDGFSQPALPGVSDGRRSRRGEGVQQPRLRLTGEAWRDVKLGEFVLGHEDEDGVVPGKDEPLLLNGTFMVWRKLRQDVDAFTRWIEAEAGDNKDAQNVLRAKILGRWPNGDSLVRHPAGVAYNGGARGHDLKVNDFTYAADADGVRCPLGAHVRRSNPRDALGFRTERTRRNRIIRRGLPYVDRDETRGLIFVCFNASIARQFEQIQGNWLMDGDSFGLGAERDFLTAGLDPGQPSVRMTIHGDRGRPPSFVTRTEQFVTVRGGHYLFVPGLAALRMIAGGG